MKESISYSFLLNIILIFIFVCASIITGIFSYYKAFRANTIIINEIEKYEGFNCNSMLKIQSKLEGISYNLPFDVKCNKNEENCVTDSLNNYKVIAYNLDSLQHKTGATLYYEEISVDNSHLIGSYIQCYNDGESKKCDMASSYQYGVYTYMYTDLPIVSSLLRIPIFSKTRKIHDFRNLQTDGTYIYDSDSFPSVYFVSGASLIDASFNYANHIKENYQSTVTGYFDINGMYMEKFGYGIKRLLDYKDIDLREAFVYNDSNNENVDSLRKTGKKKCGYVPDWSIF